MQVGVIEGDVNTSSFKFRATEKVGKFDFVSVKSNDKWILAQVDQVTKHKDGETTATANIIGYRDKGLTRAPRHVIDPDSIIYQADQELISDTLGLNEKGLRVGNLETNPDIDIMVDPDDFYKHFAVLAQTGAGKCVTPDTDVLMSDGSLEKIKKIFENSNSTVNESENDELRMINDCSIKAVNDDFEVVDADAVYAYRKKCDKILRVKTESGREIEVTEEHPLMVAENSYDFVEASELDEGMHVAVPRKSDFKSTDNIQFSEDITNKIDSENERRQKLAKNFDEFKELVEDESSVSKMSEKLGVNKSTLEKWKYQGSRPEVGQGFVIGKRMKALNTPKYINADLTEFLALILAEGAEQQENSYRVIFTNNNEGLMKKFEELGSQLFNLEPSKMRENASYIDSISLKHFLEEVGYETLQKSRSKSVPKSVMTSSRRPKRKFLRAFFDCEGSMEDHEITLSSASEEMINQISYMLLEFGIVSRISSREKQATNSNHEGDTYYRIAISGVKQMQRFSDEIGFGIDRKQERLDNYLATKKGNTNVDVIPIDGEYLKKERNKLGLSQAKLGEKIGVHSTLISLYERNERRPSREKMSEMSEHLDSKMYSNLADSDLFWDKIESIEEVSHDGYVYDITVKDHHNFIAGRGGILSHNSYTVGVLIEEMLEADFPVLVLDPHGEYSSLNQPNPDSDEPDSYEVKEFSPNTDINREALPLQFSSVNLDKKELTTLIPDSLTNSQMGVLYNALKHLKDKEDDYNLLDIQDAVSQEDSTAKWNLLNYLEQLEESGLFSENPIDLKDLVEPGRATIINLKAVEPEPTEMTAYMLAKKLFDLRKKNRIPPFIMVIEEAHNFVPEKGFGQAVSNPIMRKIASEGRKFGLGIGVISQRPARIDKNVLSQANTQFILRVTNPNDLKAISKSFEGVTSEVEDMIKSLPPGVCFLLGNDYPVMTDVRVRKSMHGGETQTADTYVEQQDIEFFSPLKDIQEIESTYGEKFETAYYPLYLVDSDEKEILVDGVKGEVKASRQRPSESEEKVLDLLAEGLDQAGISDELGISLAKVSTRIDALEDKGLLQNGEPVESVLEVERKEEGVVATDLIEYDVEKSSVESEYSGTVSKIYYPYFKSEDKVFDPILEKEI